MYVCMYGEVDEERSQQCRDVLANSAEPQEMELDSGGLEVPATAVIHATNGSGLPALLVTYQKSEFVSCAMPEMYYDESSSHS